VKITEVKITGFKSFVDGVNLPIDAGLTGIVGPNGCGKSNILESMRWVMGATSAKALRGAEMDDVIFAGTDNRPPRDIAEVILKIDNDRALAPEPFKDTQHIEISRKIKRGSGSIFRINGKEVRAKDVQLMFADASSGANSPALVRQGQISELINARPENRRKVLEEAAGIAGLQARRHDAQNKLNATEANLERIGEIIILMEGNIASLKKQATRAQKYRNLQGQIRGLELYIAQQKLLSFEENLNEVQESLKAANSQQIDAQIAFNRAQRIAQDSEDGLKPLIEEQNIAEAILRKLLQERENFIKEELAIKDKINTLMAISERFERDIIRESEIEKDAISTQINAQAEIEAIGEIIPNDQELLHLNKSLNEFEQSAIKLNSKISELISAKAKLRADFEAKSRAKNDLDRLIKNLENDLTTKSSILASAIKNLENDKSLETFEDKIKSLEDEFQTFQNTQAILEQDFVNAQSDEEIAQKKSQNINNEIAKLQAELNGLLALNKNYEATNSLISQIKVQSGYEKALSAALGEDLNAQIGKSDKNYWLGSDIEPNENIGATLFDFVTAPNELTARLKAIIIVDEADFSKTHIPFGYRFVTKGGKLKRWDGFVITGNSPQPAAIRLEQKNRIDSLKQIIAPKELEAAQIAKQYAAAKAKTMSLRDKLNQMRPKANEWQKTINQERQKIVALQNQRIRLQTQIESQKAQLDELTKRLDGNKKRRAEFGQIDNSTLNQEILAKEIQEESQRQELGFINTKIAETKSQILSISRDYDSKIQRQKSANNTLLSAKNRIKSAQIRITELKKEQVSNQTELKSCQEIPLQITKNLQNALSELPKIEARKKAADDKLAQTQTQIREAFFDMRQKEMHLGATKEAISTAQILVQNWQERISELKTQIWQNHQISADEIMRMLNAQLGETLKTLNPEKAQTRLSKALQEREDIGGVNLRAEEELKEQSERMENLANERDDLLAALKKLRKAIDEINAEGQERLLKAFEIVNQHFVELFTTLFNGGTAHLALTETDDPLGGGLEVYACPPGKRLSSMSLMSGGEQALTACALIFAVFLSNPAPISVLDELDAPLDDANVDRFCTLLDEMRKRTETRFIVITHHPITMARMDRLFGVTMAERGVSNVVAVDLSRAQSMIDN
jgi:chromosome segregation protein